MTVKFGFWQNDSAQLLDLLLWIHQIGGCKGHSALLIADAGVDYKIGIQARQLALKSFDRCEIVTTNESVIGWPGGPNNLFLTALMHDLSGGGPWLWMETDAVPLHRDWVTILEQELGDYLALARHYDCEQPGLPKRVVSGIAAHMNEVAWTSGLRKAVEAEMYKAFDLVINPIMIQKSKDTTRIQHVWGEQDVPPTFDDSVMPRKRGFMSLQQIEPGVVLFHRNKDGSLIRKLRQQRNIALPYAPPSPTHPRPQISMRRTGAIGDVLAATCVANALGDAGYDVEFQAHSSTHCVLRRTAGISRISEPNGQPQVNLDNSYEHNPNRKSHHFAKMFTDTANTQLRSFKLPEPKMFAPRMVMTENDRETGHKMMFGHPRPWTVICPRSNNWRTRTVPDHIWQQAAAKIHGTKFWIGNHGPAPHGIMDLGIQHFDTAIAAIGTADLLVSVDTGPMHVAAALGTPVVAIMQQSDPALHLGNNRDFEVIKPNLTCLNCQAERCPINPFTPPCQNVSPDLIANAANNKLLHYTADGVSVVICIYKPQVAKLNRCLAAILPQVQEVVVVSCMESYLPQGAMQDSKIRYIRIQESGIGLPRKTNFGFRHTHHRYVLWLNDDCYLNPDAVQKMREVMHDNVGLVGCELRYLDGTIQHGGTIRPPGSGGWAHIAHRKHDPEVVHPKEMENVTCAAALIRRKAFYEADGLDERLKFYCEDNQLCMCIRQSGWKVMYTPYAKGIHEEGQSSILRPEMYQTMQESNKFLYEQWKWYFEKNKNVELGTFD